MTSCLPAAAGLALPAISFTGCAAHERNPPRFESDIVLPEVESAEEEAEHEHFHRHEITAFGGLTTHGRSETGGSFGAEYEYRLTELWGAGAWGEYTGGDFDTWLAGAAVTYRPVEPLRFLGSVGAVNDDGDYDGLVRVGVWYSFPVGEYFVAPTFNVDFVEGGDTELVYGLSFGRAF